MFALNICRGNFSAEFKVEIMTEFVHDSGDKRVNQLGGHYTNGRPLSREMRMRIIDLSRQGLRQRDISNYTKVTHGCISKIVSKYEETGKVDSSENVGRPRVITAEIERKVKEYWATDPGLFCWEVRERLLREEICKPDDVPSLSSLSRLIKESMINKAATAMNEKEEMMDEEKSPKVSYTAFTIASILGLDSEDEGTSKPEVESREKSTGQQDAMVLKQQTQRRKRTTFTQTQVDELEREFRRNPYAGTHRSGEISKKLHISPVKTVQVWFANRRARAKRVSANLMRGPSSTADVGKSLRLSQNESLFPMVVPCRCIDPRVYAFRTNQQLNL